jgi:hypothetical protein
MVVFYKRMKKLILVLTILAVVPINAYAFKSVGLGFGPTFKVRGNVETSYIIEGNWNPHKNVGARVFVGFLNGLWIGAGLNTIFSLHESRNGNFDYSMNFSLPFIMNIHNGVKTAFIGFTFGNILSFAVDRTNKYYFFITPAEFVFVPVTWVLNPNGGFSTGLEISLRCAIGVKVRI